MFQLIRASVGYGKDDDDNGGDDDDHGIGGGGDGGDDDADDEDDDDDENIACWKVMHPYRFSSFCTNTVVARFCFVLSKDQR